MTELTPADAAEYAACFLARWASYADGSSDEPPGDLAPEYLRVLLAERDQLRRDLEKARKDRDSWQTIAASREPSAEPDPLNLPAYAWGESVTWNQGRILVPLNRDDQTVADLVLDEDAAGTLAAMLADAASATEGTDWGEPGTQWTCGVRKPDGGTALDEYAPPPDDEAAVRAYVDGMQDSNGYRKALLRREIGAWREVDGEAVARGPSERTPPGESIEP